MFSKHMMVGLVFAIAGIGLLLYHIFHMVRYQNVDYTYLFYVGTGLNVTGISYYLYHFQRRSKVEQSGDK